MKMKSKFAFSFLLVVLAVLAVLTAQVTAFSTAQAAEPAGGVSWDALLVQFGGLMGVGALIAFLVNIGKAVGLVKDGSAPTWSAGLNLAALALLLVTRTYRPDVDIQAVDQQVMDFVNVGVVVFSYVLQLVSSKGTHKFIKGVPVIGKSNSAGG